KTQQVILAAAANAEAKGWAGVRGKALEDTKTLADKGIVVSEPSAELMAELNKIGATMIEEWKAEAPEVAAILSNFNQ
ncbi:MAG: C4-dicarboxylate ABC transporter substrate-binding protein, partial [Motiliproteus sp.]